MTRLLISVSTAAEACLALAAGADIVDGKDAAAGPLAALPDVTLRDIVAAVAGRVPVSATIGDWPAEPDVLLQAAERVAAAGVDWVKVGFYPGGDWDACRAALAPLAQRTPLIALLLADRTPNPTEQLAAFAAAGFRGVMLDTASKDGRRLTDHSSIGSLSGFVAEARKHHLQCGLAGSLRQTDLADLLPLGADVLGFRGAACHDGRRAKALCADRVTALADALQVSVF